MAGLVALATPHLHTSASVKSGPSVGLTQLPATDVQDVARSSFGLRSAFCLGAVAGVLHRRREGRRRCCLLAGEETEKVVGIDLGTTNSAIAAVEAGKASVIPNKEGNRTTPSVVAYTTKGETLIGQMAKRQAVINPRNTFYSVKRFIGSLRSEVSEAIEDVSYEVTSVKPMPQDSAVRIVCPQLEKQLSPEEISAAVLRKLATDASSYLGSTVERAVITVPAYFNDSQRQATKDAGTIAGLQVMRIVNEPTAASLAYGLEKVDSETVLIFDLGGGTFDVSILVIGQGVCEVLATSGDASLGGDDFDRRLVDWLADSFESRTGKDLRQEPQALQRLTEAAEKAKIELSDVMETTISLPFIAMDEDGSPLQIEERLTRPRFVQLCGSLLEKLKAPVNQAIKDAKIRVKDLEEVVLVGGSTRIPAVKEIVKELTDGKEPNQTVNPDEVVALGAAVQAGVLTGDVKDLVLLDVIPLSLGIKRHDGLVSVFMPRNARVPARKTKTYTTERNNQDMVLVEVFQGERKVADENKRLGVFALGGITRAPAGKPKIEVTFNLDSNGILQVSARDLLSGKANEVVISGASTMAPEEIGKKVAEAKKAAVDEANYIRAMEFKDAAETAAYAMEEVIRYHQKITEMKQDQLEVYQSKNLMLWELIEKCKAGPDKVNLELMDTVTQDVNVDVKALLMLKAKNTRDIKDGFKSEIDDADAAKTKDKVNPTGKRRVL
mmetsp:Transcript_106473/g.189309  ORF Transcript_106473/g.189309 Transcript_106473/m.189309 type:complete len:723 (-) Transcript_106473:71-2239(-)